MNDKTETRTIKMSYDNFESAIVSFLYATSALDDSIDVVASDFGVEVDADGMIEFDLDVVVPKLRVVQTEMNV